MKTHWDIRAKDMDDVAFRAHGNGLTFLRALRMAAKYMLKYDRVIITKSTVYGGKK